MKADKKTKVKDAKAKKLKFVLLLSVFGWNKRGLCGILYT